MHLELEWAYQKQLPDEHHPLFTMATSALSNNAYTLQPPAILAIKAKIEQIGTPLKNWDINIYRGVLTGFNEAFIIDTAKKDDLIAQDPKSAEIIKPILRGRDIKAYEHHWVGLWLINSHNNPPVNINNYPAIKNHLNQYYPQLEKRLDKGRTPYNLRNCAYLAEFAKAKIVYNDITRKLSFSLSNKEQYFNNTVYFIANNPNLYFQLAILNSSLIDWYYKQISVKLGVSTVRMFRIYMEQLPIPKISTTNHQPFINLVDEILKAKKDGKDTTTLEAKINELVYQLYNLIADEIKIIEGKNE